MADYVIKGGDTLAKIAQQQGVSIDTLKKIESSNQGCQFYYGRCVH